MSKKKIIASIAAVLIVAACSKITDDNSSLFGNYDQATMLNNIGTNILLPGINNLSTSASAAASSSECVHGKSN